MTPRQARRAAFAVALAAPFLVPVVAASADPLVPRIRVYIDGTPGQWITVCGDGEVNDGSTTVGRWVFTVTGAVTDGSPIAYTQVEDGDSFFYCDNYYVGSPPDSTLTATLTFAGLGTSSDLAGAAFLVYEWNSVLGAPNTFSFGFND